jgi:hypothetical protein
LALLRLIGFYYLTGRILTAIQKTIGSAAWIIGYFILAAACIALEDAHIDAVLPLLAELYLPSTVWTKWQKS